MDSYAPLAIEWKEAYHIGFDRFDHEHAELIGLANALVHALSEEQPQSVVTVAHAALLDGASRHFDEEEALMEETFYPHRTQHRLSHNDLLRNLIRFGADIKTGAIDATFASQFLLDWLLEHVLQADVHYAVYFKQRGVK